MPRTRPPYPEQFRREAVELVRISGRPIPEIAKDLGVTDQSLRNWIRQYEVDVGQRPGIGSDEREELKRLRRENRVLKEEPEIRLLRQRGLRELPRDAEEGEDPPSAVADPRRDAQPDLRPHRRLVQPAAPSLDTRLPLTRRVRAAVPQRRHHRPARDRLTTRGGLGCRRARRRAFRHPCPVPS